ncbi:MAG TPA: FKBP-type peptidyl-prolyl cis-trans isomerase [Candidatus Saccharimonadales bacterium]|nr:FKBP-type peptidyl-prolyl cis-trans isomerase [Candidatus Saccharimonadales bacterium]
MARKTLILMLLLTSALWLAAQDSRQHPSSVDGLTPVTLPSGLAYWDLAIGTGKAAAKGSRVKVNYTGWLLEEGTKFDSSYDRKQPLQFTLGAGEVIKGWELGVAGMKVGGKRQLRVPPELAYGWRGQPPDIPRNAFLIFDVELVDVN